MLGVRYRTFNLVSFSFQYARVLQYDSRGSKRKPVRVHKRYKLKSLCIITVTRPVVIPQLHNVRRLCNPEPYNQEASIRDNGHVRKDPKKITNDKYPSVQGIMHECVDPGDRGL